MNYQLLVFLLNFGVIPVVDLTRTIEWVKNAAADIVKWAALRLLLITLVGTLVPLAIYKGWMVISEQIFSFISENTGSQGWTGTMVSLSGLAAWMGVRLKLVECFQVFSTFLSLKFVLGFIKR